MAFTVCVLSPAVKRDTYIASYIAGEAPVTGHDVMNEMITKHDMSGRGIIAWFVNNYSRPLDWVIDEDATVEFIPSTSTTGQRIYRRTLGFVLIMACARVLRRKIILRHSIADGNYWEFEDGPATQTDIDKLKIEMNEIIRRDSQIKREVLTIDKARRVFQRQGENEIAELFVRANLDPVEVYRCGERYGYFCGTPLAPSTGQLRVYDLVLYDQGMLLRFPDPKAPEEILDTKVEPSMGKVFFDYAHWLQVLDLDYLNKLHHRVTEGKITELILIAEAFHSQKLGSIAEDIAARPVKVVTIAGPSGSGKTTFSERLKVQLMVCGKTPVTLPLDNYFKEREDSPRDETGEYDYERLDALDLDLLEANLTQILAGEEVVTPVYNFITGKKEPGKIIRLKPSDVLIMEGIHGLNDRILAMLPEASRYGIFVSPLTGICIDPHNRTSTGDNRLLRRIIRDYRTRGKSAQVTLEVYPKVVRGAKKYIFPYQSRADAIFNSALPYELGVLKPYVEPLLHTVDEHSSVFSEALRLLNILRFVPALNNDGIPNNSVIREFIGGSCLDV
ncbi:MAG: nucleoside kinase [Synergistaceae bacterium]|nr:nucleoside kinase [Synergistaceae bacterium]